MMAPPTMIGKAAGPDFRRACRRTCEESRNRRGWREAAKLMAAFKSQRNGKTPPAVIIKANGNHRLTMGHCGELKTGLRGLGGFCVPDHRLHVRWLAPLGRDRWLGDFCGDRSCFVVTIATGVTRAYWLRFYRISRLFIHLRFSRLSFKFGRCPDLSAF
jgi:hypothetical protein